ncbi:MAG: UDP-3-O-acyl-N-acetylglucosamine deacetylase [Geminicoccaceae bacterium]
MGAAELEPGGVKRPRMRKQRTLRQVIGCAGVGLHSGARVALTLRPAAEDTGIWFRRVDRPGAPSIHAHPDNADTVDGATCLVDAAGGAVRSVDLLLAAIAACELDNLLVELSGPEVPAMSGTPQPFMLLLECAGIVEQSRAAPWLEVMRPVEVVADGASARVEPGLDLEVAIEQADAPTFALTAQAGDVRGALFDRREPRRSPLDRKARERGRAVAFEALAGLALIPAGVSARYVERAGGPELRCALMRELLSDPANYRLRNAGPVLAIN